MSGQLTLTDLESNIICQRRDHAKYIVQIAVHHDAANSVAYIATAGWDSKVNLYQIPLDQSSPPTLQEPFSTITLPMNPESLLFATNTTTSEPNLILTRRDSTFLYYYSLHSSTPLIGRQNLAPHSNAWIAFTPSSISLSPTDPSTIAIATSAVPHMKLLIVRLLFPSPATEQEQSRTQADQARLALAVQDREDAAILIHCSTLAPQTAYSTPQVTWRPDGTGVWVNGDDGVVRGFEAKTGKVMATLKGHEAGSKVRCLAAGMVEGEEWLVSGGFDRRLIVWRPAKAAV